MLPDKIFEVAQLLRSEYNDVTYSRVENDRGLLSTSSIKQAGHLYPFHGTLSMLCEGLYFGDGHVTPVGFLASKRKQRDRRYATPAIFTSVSSETKREIVRDPKFLPASHLGAPDTFARIPIYFGRHFEGKSAVALGDLHAAITITFKDFEQDKFGDIRGRFGVIRQTQMYHVVETIEELGL
jgi:hypothetical protein